MCKSQGCGNNVCLGWYIPYQMCGMTNTDCPVALSASVEDRSQCVHYMYTEHYFHAVIVYLFHYERKW